MDALNGSRREESVVRTSAIVTGLWAIQKQRLRIGTEKRACVHEWSRSRFVGNPETEPLQPRPLLSQNILTRHATISYCIRNYSLPFDNTTIPLPALTLSFLYFAYKSFFLKDLAG